MKEVINRKRYNTETSECITSWSNGYNPGDFHYCEEDLYKTKNGAYFIAGDGGALSEYSEQCGSGRCGGEGIRVLDPDQAYAWLERNGSTESLEAEFPDRIEEA